MSWWTDLRDGITGRGATKAAEKAGRIQADANRYAADLSNKQFETTRADQMPWLEAGKKALGGLDGMLYGDPSAYMNDPSYQWRKQQGMDGIQASASAMGGLLSGATLKALNEHNSNLASTEYNNTFNRLSGVAGTGQNTANALGQFGANNANAVGNALTNGANAQANGLIGRANANAQGIGNIMRLGSMAFGMV